MKVNKVITWELEKQPHQLVAAVQNWGISVDPSKEPRGNKHMNEKQESEQKDGDIN